MANITSKTELNETPADGDLLYLVDVSDTTDNANGSDKKITRANLVGGLQAQPAEGAFVDGDKTKLDGIEAAADVTDTASVTAAGALMDSEVTNLAQVKAFSSADYATAAQGATADTALQPTDIASGTITARTGAVNLSGGSDGDVMTVQADGSLALETPAGGGGQTLYDAVVAPSGGDYTTLGAALAAASAGWRIFVEAGTYSESAITATLDDITIIGAGTDNTILNFATNAFTITTNNLIMRDFKMSFSTGVFTDSGANSLFENIYLLVTGIPPAHSGSWIQQSTDSRYYNVTFNNTSTTISTYKNVKISGANCVFDSCHFGLNVQGRSTVIWFYLCDNLLMEGCTFEVNYGTSSADVCYINEDDISFNSCRFINSQNAAYAITHVGGVRLSVTNCKFTGWNRAFNLGVNGDGPVHATGNYIKVTTSSDYAFYLSGATEVNIANNTVHSASTSNTHGVRLASNSDRCSITGNMILDCAYGIIANDATVDDTLIASNHLSTCTTPLTDNGTNTTSSGNKTT